jgi:hypothetical protein
VRVAPSAYRPSTGDRYSARHRPASLLEPTHPSVVHRAFATTIDAMTSPRCVSSCSTVTTMLSRWQSGHRSLRVTKLLGTERTVGHHSEHLWDHYPHSDGDLGTGRTRGLTSD